MDHYYAYTDGSNVDLLCASVDFGVQNIRLNTIPFAGYPAPTHLRLQRAGTTYTAYYPGWRVLWQPCCHVITTVSITTHTRIRSTRSFGKTPLSSATVSSTWQRIRNLSADGAYVDGYFYDEIHPTQAGYEQVAAMTSSYINCLDGYTIANPDNQSLVNYKMTSADNYINANVNGSGSWTLPECQGLTGKSYQITNKESGVLRLSGTNSESISDRMRSSQAPQPLSRLI